MTDFYRKILEPILDLDATDLRKAATILEITYPENDDNLTCDARHASAEVLHRIAQLKDFCNWILSDELGEELEKEHRE